MPTVRERIEGREVENEAGGRGNEGVQRRYTRVFDVELDVWSGSNAQDIIDAQLAEGIPRLGDPFTTGRHTDLGARCHSVVPSSTAEPRFFVVTAQYSSSPGDFGEPEKEVGNAANEPGQNDNAAKDPNNPQSQDNDDPLSRPAEISWSQGSYSEVITKATRVSAEGGEAKEMPVTNSAGEPFDPPLEVEKSFLILTITRNQANFNPNTASSYTNATNSDKFFGFEAGKVKCKGISGVSVFEKNRHFWKATYVFEIRESWDYELLDAGYWEIVAGKRKAIAFQNGRPIPGPWPLDGAGLALTEAQVAADQGYVYRKYRIADSRVAFAGLNLP